MKLSLNIEGLTVVAGDMINIELKGLDTEYEISEIEMAAWLEALAEVLGTVKQ